MVKSSSLPIIIMSVRKICALGSSILKLSTGPRDPIPGPTLASEVAIAPTEVSNGVGSSSRNNENTMVPEIRMIR